MSILIVDDSKPFRLAMAAILNDRGYTGIRQFGSAMEALDHLEKNEGSDFCDGVCLILLDVQMPQMDGIEFLKIIKKDRRYRDIPVVMVTVRDDETKIEEAFSAGAVDYISKPLRALELTARIRSVLQLQYERKVRREKEQELMELNESLKEMNRQLKELSEIDPLTGLFNRRYFNMAFERSWKHCRRYQQPLSLIVADIDHFKAYNDTYGHPKGDLAIMEVARCIFDSVSRPDDIAVRLGGEEFLVMMPDTGAGGAEVIAGNIRHALRQSCIEHSASEVSPCLTLSMGAASIVPSDETDTESLMRNADNALYRAKESGRDRIILFE